MLIRSRGFCFRGCLFQFQLTGFRCKIVIHENLKKKESIDGAKKTSDITHWKQWSFECLFWRNAYVLQLKKIVNGFTLNGRSKNAYEYLKMFFHNSEILAKHPPWAGFSPPSGGAAPSAAVKERKIGAPWVPHIWGGSLRPLRRR